MDRNNFLNVPTCKICRYKSKLLINLLEHVNRHRLRHPEDHFSCHKDIPEPYSCPYCDFKTEWGVIFRNHVIDHRRRNPQDYALRQYECIKCKFRTFSILVLTKHHSVGCDETTEDQDQTEKPYKCDQCHFESNCHLNMRYHKIAERIRDEDLQWFECDQCDRRYKGKEGLAKHQRICHKNGGLLFKLHGCDQCPYRTKWEKELSKHRRLKHASEIGKKLFECDKCDAVLSYKQSLNNHIIFKHTDPTQIKWFKCDKCPYKAKKKSSLKSHKSRHLDSVLRWQCDKCGYQSARKFLLEQHVLYYDHDEPIK